jgi:aminoglycoside phosphotransferase
LTDDVPQEASQDATKSHQIKHNIVFTHGDLNLRNILVDDAGRITGIVDWESARWFPEYWEYTKAHFGVRDTIRWLADVIDRVFLSYREELHVENMISDLAPPF